MIAAEGLAYDLISASSCTSEGARVVNLVGTPSRVEDFVRIIGEVIPESRGRLTVGGTPLTFPDDMDGVEFTKAHGTSNVTPLLDRIADSVELVRNAGPRRRTTLMTLSDWSAARSRP